MRADPFSKLLFVHLLFLTALLLSGSLFEVYFLGLGLALEEMFLTAFLLVISAPLLIPFFRKLEMRQSILVGILLGILSTAILYFIPSTLAAYLFRFTIGLTFFIYWVPFNTRYYEFRKKNHAVLGALYFSLMPLLSLVLPAMAGGIAQGIGYGTVYLLAMGAYILAGLAAWKLLEVRTYRYDFPRSFQSLRGLRTLIFLEGFAAMAIIGFTLKTMLLLFADTPLEFGGFLSLTTLFAVAASIFVARISDIRKNRRTFLILSALGLSFAALFTSQANSLAWFFVGFGLVTFFRTVFLPLPLALTVDNSVSLIDSMVAREFMLGLGRSAAALVGYFIFVYADLPTMVLLQGIVLLLYIPFFEWKKKKLEWH